MFFPPQNDLSLCAFCDSDWEVALYLENQLHVIVFF